jgi:signal transduction histidine kinase
MGRVAMTTAFAAVSTHLRLAVYTRDEPVADRIGEVVAQLPDAPFVERVAGLPELCECLESQPGELLVLLDGREENRGGRQVWQALRERELQVHPVVVLVDDDAMDEDWPAVETLRISQLVPRDLKQALQRARQVAALAAQLRQLRAEREGLLSLKRHMERAKDRQERMLQGIMRSLPLLIGRLDHRGRVVETHGQGFARCGITPELVLKRRLGLVLPQARLAVRQALQGETTHFSLRGWRDGQEWHADFVILPETGKERGAIFIGRDVSERRWLEQQLLTATEAEQKRIGADLHDGLGQQLTGLACLVAGLRDRLKEADASELAAQADFIVEVANDATRQSRALARGLCPVQLEGASLQSALSDLVYQAEQLHSIRCQFRSRGEAPPLDHFTAIHLYRITQEALHNAVRHGNARNVSVTLVSRGPRHRLTIADDGRGFNSRAPAPIASRGLRLMKYRAGMIGGSLSIITRPGRGTRVLCQFAHESAPHEEPS